MPANKPYTPAEDAEILTANASHLAVLAERWDRTQVALISRRYKLRKAGAVPKIPLADLRPPGPNFARPAFFVNEDLHKIALIRR